MEKEVKYIGFYDLVNIKYKKNSCLSAINKMNYIMNTVARTGSKVRVVSPSWYIDKNAPKTPTQIINVEKDITLVQGPSYSTRNRITGRIKSYFSLIWLFFYLMTNVKQDEEIIAYHSLALIPPLMWAKKIKKFRLIYEVEEIYSDIVNCSKRQRKAELNMINSADKYIFPTELLNDKLNKQNKPYSIIYGTYNVEDEFNCKFDDNRIHVVYAGTFDPRKGGAIAAAAAAEYLDENYHIHIIGFGSEEEKFNLKELIKNVSKKTKCKVTYDGLYKGEEYIKFLQKCDIGLSTQTPDAEYNDTSFPSKVLSYMCNGLRVVSVRIKALEKSEISGLLYYYDENTPECIANAIKSIKIEDQYNSRSIIKELNKKFTKDIEDLLN